MVPPLHALWISETRAFLSLGWLPSAWRPCSLLGWDGVRRVLDGTRRVDCHVSSPPMPQWSELRDDEAGTRGGVGSAQGSAGRRHMRGLFALVGGCERV